MARRLSTSRSQLDRLLDPKNEHVTLHILSRGRTGGRTFFEAGTPVNIRARRIMGGRQGSTESGGTMRTPASRCDGKGVACALCDLTPCMLGICYMTLYELLFFPFLEDVQQHRPDFVYPMQVKHVYGKFKRQVVVDHPGVTV